MGSQITYDEAEKRVAAGRIDRIVVLYGQTLLRTRLTSQIRDRLLPEDLRDINMAVFTGQKTARPVIDAAETLPLMVDRRLVVLRESPLFLAKKKKGGGSDAGSDSRSGEDAPEADAEGADQDPEETGGAAAEANALAEWLPRAPETCCLVFTADAKPGGSRKLEKALDAAAVFVDLTKPGDPTLYRLCTADAAKLGHRFAPGAYEFFRHVAGEDYTHLYNELSKLCAYVGQREILTEDDVTQIVTPSAEYGVFRMIDMLMAGRAAEAHVQLEALLARGESPYGIVSLLARQLRIMTHVRLMRAEGISLQEIQQKLSWNPYALNQAARLAARYAPEALLKGYEACVSADWRIKSGQARMDEGLDQLMLALSRMGRDGAK